MPAAVLGSGSLAPVHVRSLQRTLPAWIRTAIARIALGPVLARFSSVLRSLDPRRALGATHRLSLGLVVSGGALDLLAGLAYARRARTAGGRPLPLLLVAVAGGAAAYPAAFIVPHGSA